MVAGLSGAALSGLILLLALVLFVSEKVRHDLVAVIALFASVVAGLVTPAEALLGFADPAVVAVAAVLVVGRAIELTGFAATLARSLIPQHWSFAAQLSVLLAVGAALSGFMNNIAALVITMPLATQLARNHRLPAGAVLMPLAFATILGGMTTLIGTPANLILSSVREEQLGEPLAFFSMTGVGVTVALVGLLYLGTIGWRLIPLRQTASRAARPWRVFELLDPARDADAALKARLRSAGARLLGRFRDGQRLREDEPAWPGDRLLLLSRNDQRDVAERAALDPTAEMSGLPGAVTARAVVAHNSLLIGEGYESVLNRSDGKVAVVGGGPRPARLRQPLATIQIEAGDQLYLRGPADALAAVVTQARLLIIDRFDPSPLDRPRALLAVAVFALSIIAAVSGLASPAIAFFAAAAAVAGLRLLPADEVYRAIDWPVIVLIAAMIPVGASFESTGAANIVAGAMADMLASAPVFVMLAVLTAGTLLLSIFLNNVATAVIMGPIALDLSGLLGISPDAALLAVLIGASSDFLTPIGHQNNMLVMGPGGYRFTDYARVGALLALLTVVSAAGFLTLTFDH